MTKPEQNVPSVGDLAGNAVIGAMTLTVFVAGYVEATTWPSAASLFPRLITVSGALLSVAFLVQLGVRVLAARGRRAAAPSEVSVSVGAAVSDSPAEGDPGAVMSGAEEEDFGLDYAFANASRSQWTHALSWLVAYFAGLWITGAVIATVVITVLYLRFEARVRLVTALIYAAALFAVMWVSQEYFQLDLPPGLLFDR